MSLAEPTRTEAFEEDEQFRLGDNPVSLKVKGPQKLLGFLKGVPTGLVELDVKFIEEGVELVDIEGATAIIVIQIEGLIDEHSQDSVVQSCHIVISYFIMPE